MNSRGDCSLHKTAAALMLFWSSPASAGVLNVEFKFTPYTGDPKEDHVQTVPGKAQVFLNNVLMAEQEVGKGMVPVLFDEREIAPSVWVPVGSLGPVLRKGGALYDLGGPKAFARIKDDETQMCAGVALSIAYPPHLAFVRTPAGGWEVVY